MRNLLIIFTLLILASCSGGDYSYDASGTFEATEILISSEASGKIIYLNIEEGQKVEADRPVGLVDTIQLSLQKKQLATSRRAVGSRRLDVNMQIASIEEQIATQIRERDRVQRLLDANAANQKQLDDMNAQINVLRRQLDAQRAALESTNSSLNEEGTSVEVQIELIDDMIRRSQISSPIDGTILAKYAEPGELVSAGKPLFKVADIERMTLRAYVTSTQLTQVRLGQSVKVYTASDDKSARQYEGRVAWISDKAEFTPKTIQTRDERANLVYAVKIDVENDGFIKIGMYGDVEFR